MEEICDFCGTKFNDSNRSESRIIQSKSPLAFSEYQGFGYLLCSKCFNNVKNAIGLVRTCTMGFDYELEE
jgi:hypothetical protein